MAPYQRSLPHFAPLPAPPPLVTGLPSFHTNETRDQKMIDAPAMPQSSRLPFQLTKKPLTRMSETSTQPFHADRHTIPTLTPPTGSPMIREMPLLIEDRLFHQIPSNSPRTTVPQGLVADTMVVVLELSNCRCKESDKDSRPE